MSENEDMNYLSIIKIIKEDELTHDMCERLRRYKTEKFSIQASMEVARKVCNTELNDPTAFAGLYEYGYKCLKTVMLVNKIIPNMDHSPDEDSPEEQRSAYEDLTPHFGWYQSCNGKNIFPYDILFYSDPNSNYIIELKIPKNRCLLTDVGIFEEFLSLIRPNFLTPHYADEFLDPNEEKLFEQNFLSSEDKHAFAAAYLLHKAKYQIDQELEDEGERIQATFWEINDNDIVDITTVPPRDEGKCLEDSAVVITDDLQYFVDYFFSPSEGKKYKLISIYDSDAKPLTIDKENKDFFDINYINLYQNDNSSDEKIFQLVLDLIEPYSHISIAVKKSSLEHNTCALQRLIDLISVIKERTNKFVLIHDPVIKEIVNNLTMC